MATDSINWVMSALSGGVKWARYSTGRYGTVWAGYAHGYLYSVVVVDNSPRSTEERQIPIVLRSLGLDERTGNLFLSLFEVPQIRELITASPKKFAKLRPIYIDAFKLLAECLSIHSNFGNGCVVTLARIAQIVFDVYGIELNTYWSYTNYERALFAYHLEKYHPGTGIKFQLTKQDETVANIVFPDFSTHDEFREFINDSDLTLHFELESKD